MRLRTPLTELIGIEHPVVQTGMGWVSGARLTAATAAAGGLGIIASSTMSIPELEAAIRSVKESTDKPFGVNIRSDGHDVGERVDLMIREGVKVASFALAPREDLIKKLKDAVPSDQAPTCKLHIMLDGIETQLAGVADAVSSAADDIQAFLGGVLVDDQRVAYIIRPAA